MAAIDRATLVYRDGATDRTALYAVRNVTTGDELDVSTAFSSPKQAVFLSSTTNQRGLCTIAGTVVTIPVASLAGDAGYLLVQGSAA